MAENYRFFNSAEGDIREYTASEFAEYFSRFLSDGLYAINGDAGLKVTSGAGLTVDIGTGYAFVRGYLYHNDSPLNIALSPADTILHRIDRLVLRFDEVAREIKVAVKIGNFSSTPQPPAIVVTDTVKEMTLAQVRVNAGATNVTAIIDERFKETCGLVEILASIPLNDFMDQWNAWFAGRQNETGGRVFSGPTEPAEMLAGDIWLKELV